jgi:hypothetical protein
MQRRPGELRVVRYAPNQSGYRFPLGSDPSSHIDFGVLSAHDPVVGDWGGAGLPVVRRPRLL